MVHQQIAARSWLFVPGDRPDRFDKAAAAGADAVICDLEDAVGAENKDRARQEVVAWLAEHRAIVRVNATGTPWHAADLAAVASVPGLLGVVLPKTATADDNAAAAAGLPASVPVLPLVESAIGVENARDIAAAPRAALLLFGSVDLRLDLGLADADSGTTVDDDALLYARSRLVMASRAAGVAPPVDGVTTNLTHPDATALDAARARRLGFGGKLCVHPRQVAPVNAAFLPSATELDRARRVVAAADAAHGSAVRLDGEMIDAPRIAAARRVLAAAPRPTN